MSSLNRSVNDWELYRKVNTARTSEVRPALPEQCSQEQNQNVDRSNQEHPDRRIDNDSIQVTHSRCHLLGVSAQTYRHEKSLVRDKHNAESTEGVLHQRG